jgi:hypothetical protein
VFGQQQQKTHLVQANGQSGREKKQAYHYPSTLPFLSITRGVSIALAIYIEKCLKPKEELFQNIITL